MFRRRTLPLSRFALAGLSLLAAARLNAQLAANSPFQPVPSSAPAAAVADTQLKYGGFIQTSEGTLYRISDPSRKAAAFVKLNQRDETLGVTVKQHDTNSNSVTVDFGGRTLTLAEPKVKIVSNGGMPAPAPVTVPGVPPAGIATTNMSPAVTASVVANPTPADEQRRLDAVAAEVARRRAMREQSSTGAPPPQQPAPPAR